MKLLIISCAAVINATKLGTLKGDGGTFYFPAKTTQKPVGEFQAWFHFLPRPIFYLFGTKKPITVENGAKMVIIKPLK